MSEVAISVNNCHYVHVLDTYLFVDLGTYVYNNINYKYLGNHYIFIINL